MSISNILHDLRAKRLQKAPKTTGTVLSAGCSGTFYFNWFEENYGRVNKHIGIELFAPKPDDLPDYVEWISNTVGNMSDVDDNACDLIFSGQNIEHLWPEDVIASLLESYRVLKPGGHLIIDSPNRHVTAKLKWIHPEHMIEFTPQEAKAILKLAGFNIKNIYGVWACIDPDTKTVMDFDGVDINNHLSNSDRIKLGQKHPKESFIWWIEAEKSNRLPDSVKLQEKVYSIFNKAWSERKSRTSSQGYLKGKTQFKSDGLQKEFLIYGPYIPLPAGDYLATYQFDIPKVVKTKNIIIECDIVSIKNSCIAKHYATIDSLRQNNGKLEILFSLEELHFGIEARCLVLGNCPVSVEKNVKFRRIGDINSKLIL